MVLASMRAHWSKVTMVQQRIGCYSRGAADHRRVTAARGGRPDRCGILLPRQAFRRADALTRDGVSYRRSRLAPWPASLSPAALQAGGLFGPQVDGLEEFSGLEALAMAVISSLEETPAEGVTSCQGFCKSLLRFERRNRPGTCSGRYRRIGTTDWRGEQFLRFVACLLGCPWSMCPDLAMRSGPN